ncbi:unnamed protein product [Fraxinus pennsylvanica]|uniref:Aluminum-activated malate transporter n=1 Tax=Fraxinus pennsylvanica TaxID=56036 RepID=A0AAD2E8L2_9LAMI|nr:unnamed protein product [Fraxinus pennsylvanica]
MEVESRNQEEVGFFVLGCLWVKRFPKKFLSEMVEIAKQAKKIAKDDPRKVIHSLKVGLALNLVSLFYYIQPLYRNFGDYATWAVITVVVVFEFTVGATLGKGINRGLATLAAGALGLGAYHLTTITGKPGEPILIGIFVFLQAAASTFIRFFPRVKARYDYGMLIFILTFCLVSISGFRTNDLLDLALKRLYTVLIGASTSVIVSIFVCPVWAGGDLHKLVALNLERLGKFLEGFADEILNSTEAKQSENDVQFRGGMNGILDSKNREEILANFARWEPGHGQFMYRHPWKQYLKIGNLTRQCARRVEALNCYLNPKTLASKEINGMIQEAFSNMSSESGKALKELALAIKTMTMPSSPNPHVTNLQMASRNLKSFLKSDFCEDVNFLKIMPVAAVSSLLIETVNCVENIADAVNELASLANFKGSNSNGAGQNSSKTQCRIFEQPPEDETPHVISINEPTSANEESQSSVHTSGQKLTL